MFKGTRLKRSMDPTWKKACPSTWKHYQSQRIVRAEIDYDHGYTKYEVYLTNGIE